MLNSKKNLFQMLFPPVLLFLLLSQIGLSLSVSWIVRQQGINETRQDLSDTLNLLENLFREQPVLLNAPQLKAMFSGQRYRITVIRDDGKVIAESKAELENLDNHHDRPEVAEARKIGRGFAIRYSNSVSQEMVYLAQTFQSYDGTMLVLRASMPLVLLENFLRSFYFQLVVSILFISSCGFVFVLFVVNRIREPIESLVDVAREYGRGNLYKKSSVSIPQELAILSETMSGMAGQLQQKIDESMGRQKELEAILSGMMEGVIFLNRDMVITQLNRSAKRILNLAETERCIGKSLLEVVRITELRDLVERVYRTGEKEEAVIQPLTMAPQTLQIYGALVPEQKGCILVLHDISRLMKLEQIRRDFVANVSHELKTPITAIKGYIEALQDGAMEEPERARRFLEIAAAHTNRLELIVEDLLALARLEAQEGKNLEKQAVNLYSLLENTRQACQYLAEEKQIRVLLEGPKDLIIQANDAILEQAFINLVDNALKYSEPRTEVRILIEATGDNVRIDVIDQGRGIPAKDLDRIFERFYRVDKGRSRAAGGTGLGLSIVKHVVSLHNGEVRVESREGVGSTFTVILPLT
ncbi:cell wall metabolism sensor histidine kinase WalK [Gracilinema caldarium]|uniref:sensor histidine kinase n=1 Tax=Gracilinema caldarium TaxID=215591 RepID=UPI0026EE35A8|nr:ATP-binding protein [Gracilinema caldarium]